MSTCENQKHHLVDAKCLFHLCVQNAGFSLNKFGFGYSVI